MTIKVFKNLSETVGFTGKCIIENDTSIRHYHEGKHHRTDGPAIECNNGAKFWYIHGKPHRTDGPALEFFNGSKEWWVDGKLHRVDGPACVYASGAKSWWLNGDRHRLDGPAVEAANGEKSWYVDGEKYTQAEFNNMRDKLNEIKNFASISEIPNDFSGVCELPGSTHHYKNGVLHNQNGPALFRGYKEDLVNKSKEWFFEGDRHRIDGPAIEYENGNKEWWFNGKRHRVDGPAIEYGDNKQWYIHGKLHRLDGPAIENKDSGKSWFIEDKQYSEEDFNKKISKMNMKKFKSSLDVSSDFTGLCEVIKEGAICHYKNGKLHNESGPAVKANYGELWYVNGKHHRTDGPASEYADGTKYWYLNGKRHRTDGPACEYTSGAKEWYIEGKKYSEEDFNKKISEMNIIEFESTLDIPIAFTGSCKLLHNNQIRHYKNGELHRTDGPAVEDLNGYKEWRVNNKKHRVDGPAIEFSNGDKAWYFNNNYHRVDGPAIECVNGKKQWFIEGIEYSVKEFNEKLSSMTMQEFKYTDDVPVNFTGVCRVLFTDEICHYKDGKLHNENGPAMETNRGSKYWFINGKRHRTDGPAIERSNGSKEWYINNFLHRIDGPAIEYANGHKEWLVNGQHHRLNAPAIEYADGSKKWCKDGQYHRLDGPAIEYISGTKSYWIEGENYFEQEFIEKISSLNIQGKNSEMNIKEFKCEADAQDLKFNGPIRVTSIPATIYLKNGERHREDGPAFEADGIKTWWLNGKLHRLDGPAIENEKKSFFEYWVNGEIYSKQDFIMLPEVKKFTSEKNAITKKDEEMKTLKENKNFIIKCAKDAKYRVAGEQLSLAVRAAIVKILSNGESEYMQNAEMIMSTDFGKALVQGGVSLIMHQLPTENAHVQALTYELMVSSVATGEGAILTAAFSSLNDFVKGQITSIKDDTLAPARVDANEDLEEETSSESKSKLTS